MKEEENREGRINVPIFSLLATVIPHGKRFERVSINYHWLIIKTLLVRLVGFTYAKYFII